MRKNTLFTDGVIVGVLCITAIAFFIYILSGDSGVTKATFAEEFMGAYSETVVPSGASKDIEIVASEGTVQLIKGDATEVWHYNGTVPGPEIRIQKRDALHITFVNNLPQASTLHFHGIRVPNAMDGVPDVTQQSVQPGDSFVYTFTPKDAGTFWFHPHKNSSEQLERGLYGTIIVEDEYTEQYSQDVVWVIDDWLLEETNQIYPHFVTRHDLAHDGRWGNVLTANGSVEEMLLVRPGERIRLRLVNASNGRVYALHFGDLSAHAIAVDGMYVKEIFDANGFVLAPGNRIDVDITIPKDAHGRSFAVQDRFTQHTITLGTITVEGSLVETPQFSHPTNSKVPEWSGAFDESVDEEYILDARLSATGDIEWTISGDVFAEHTHIPLRYKEFNKIRFTNKSPRLHPMHLHGQFFKVISRNSKPVDEPYFRDTVLIGPKEVVDIGLVPLDKGVWMNHCHIAEHADAGMMASIVVE